MSSNESYNWVMILYFLIKLNTNLNTIAFLIV